MGDKGRTDSRRGRETEVELARGEAGGWLAAVESQLGASPGSTRVGSQCVSRETAERPGGGPAYSEAWGQLELPEEPQMMQMVSAPCSLMCLDSDF